MHAAPAPQLAASHIACRAVTIAATQTDARAPQNWTSRRLASKMGTMYARKRYYQARESEICVSARAGLRRTERAWYATEGAPPGGWLIAHQIDVAVQEKFRASQHHKRWHNACPAHTLNDASSPRICFGAATTRPRRAHRFAKQSDSAHHGCVSARRSASAYASRQPVVFLPPPSVFRSDTPFPASLACSRTTHDSHAYAVIFSRADSRLLHVCAFRRHDPCSIHQTQP